MINNNETQEDIYKNDGLKREFFCKSVVKAISKDMNNHNGLFVTLNGGYGSGKTTCLEFIEKEFSKLKTDKFCIIKYNAWQFDFYDNSLISLISAIEDSINDTKLQTLKSKIIKCGQTIFRLVFGAGKNYIKGKTGIDLDDANKQTIFDDIHNYNNAITELQEALSEIVKAGYKIIVIVDELDRCLPYKVIKVLENLYRILSINGIATIIAVDKNQLEQTIMQIFGKEINIQGYLTRFIDYDFEVPNNTQNEYLKEKYFWIPMDAFKVLDLFNFQLREKLKIISEMELNDNIDDSEFQIITYTILLSTKRDNPKLYKILPRTIYSYSNKTKKIEDTIFYKFNEYIKGLGIYDELEDAKAYQIYLLGLFGELIEIDINELKAYTRIDQLNQATLASRIAPNRDILTNMIKFIDTISN